MKMLGVYIFIIIGKINEACFIKATKNLDLSFIKKGE